MPITMSRARLTGLIIGSIILAIPMVTFISALVVFPLVFYAGLAIVANLAPLPILAMQGLRHLGIRIDPAWLIEMWISCGILWIGCAHGLARWGDTAGALGARNEPYFKVLFMPWVVLYQYLTG
jgi:hypothetical protein